jgi:hypothetical protein
VILTQCSVKSAEKCGEKLFGNATPDLQGSFSICPDCGFGNPRYSRLGSLRYGGDISATVAVGKLQWHWIQWATIAPLNAARTAQRAIPTHFKEMEFERKVLSVLIRLPVKNRKRKGIKTNAEKTFLATRRRICRAAFQFVQTADCKSAEQSRRAGQLCATVVTVTPRRVRARGLQQLKLAGTPSCRQAGLTRWSGTLKYTG